ncbi:hypothetical protein SSP24_82860 [Streptomyces spinoverrucosus]|uniref:Uncharacterized protein n=1 Tax=Streptomyces spinoverrucosus TaxID=284043 RepID=A0A4Y3VY15_9ACTN|nr:hypothetical protein SSP24_82860 [Streptomyces spinoverrucosus]GHB51466.1 hypothetical protein GCM10010397_22210 [Streptomyces spinoverrucosus]
MALTTYWLWFMTHTVGPRERPDVSERNDGQSDAEPDECGTHDPVEHCRESGARDSAAHPGEQVTHSRTPTGREVR